jgi:acyl-coenzyme A synthetase/AMP-(fatty) acid ligase
MYGLESTVLMPLQSGAALHAGHPFYPADICAALASLPRPRVLVTTPYHLRALLNDQPRCRRSTSSFRPPPRCRRTWRWKPKTASARRSTRSTAAPRPARSPPVAPAPVPSGKSLPDVRLRSEGQTIWAEGGHIDSPTRLNDVIEPTGDGPEWTTFLLHGRHADLVNIAGKRTSLAYLNHQLNAIPGVQDGVFLLPREDGPQGIGRLTALVVAPGLTAAALTRALRERIDPLFLPRPLLFVDALPRNATGKLPNQSALDLLAALQAETGLPA